MLEGSGVSSLRYIGLGDTSGYAVAAAALLRALRNAGVDVVWEPMLPGGALGLGYEPAASAEAGPADLRALRDDARVCDTTIIHFVPEYYPHFIARERARGARRIVGHTIWETDRLPSHWPDLINQLDGLIVPTEWNRAVFRESGIIVPILVAPHLPSFPDEPPVADRDGLRRRLPDLEGRRVFYTIATWLERKGVEPLIEAFTRAFGPNDPVALVIKTSPHDLERVRRDPGHEGEPLPVTPQFEAMIGRAVLRLGRLPPPIHLLTDDLTDPEMRALHDRGDCFVSLCRGEGWGLGAFEAAWLGKPVVITGWGGPAEYLSTETAYLVDWTPAPVRPAEANASYTPDQNWAEPDVESAAKALRSVMSDPTEAARRGALAAARLPEAISPPTVVRQLLRGIEELPARAPEETGAACAPKDDLAPVQERGADPAPMAAAPNEGLKDAILRNLLFRDDARASVWLREWILLDRQGRQRQSSRRLLYKKNGSARAAAAAWLHDRGAEEEPFSIETYSSRMRTLRESGELGRARRLCVMTTRKKHRLGQAIHAALGTTRLTIRIARRLPLDFSDDLYLVVDPHHFRLIPPVARSLYFLSETSAGDIDDELVAFLSRGLGVLAPSQEIIAILQRHGLPLRQIYLVPDRCVDETGPRVFFGMDNLAPRALHGVGVLSDDEFERATAHLVSPSRTYALCLPEYLDRFENARRNLLPGAILYPGLRHVEPWMGCAASYRHLARNALKGDGGPLSIHEDDAEFEPDVEARLAAIRAYLDSLPGGWDVLSGLITDLSETATVSRVEDWEGERLVTLDRTVGLVFSIFNRRAIESLAKFSVEGSDIQLHTIDRYLERQNFVCVTPERPLAAHRKDMNSTLWLNGSVEDPHSAVNNGLMSVMIEASQSRLRIKLQNWLREHGSGAMSI
jgi:glycosyltransferase involved in cell wall biosynthesis